MFSSGELERVSMALDEPMKELEMRIMQDVVRRIKINGEITAAADWQINRLQQLGMSKEEVNAAIQEALSYSDEDMNELYSKVIGAGYTRDRALYEATGTPFIPFEENGELQQLISSVSDQTNQTLHNITQSLGFAERGTNGKISFTPLADFYQETLDSAMLDISSGAFDYNTVLKRTVKAMTDSGLRTVDYASGHSNRVDVAARRAVMTGMTQLTAKVNEQNAEQLGTDMFEVSWHGGARPEHQVWQGKWYTKAQLETVCGLGTVTGLCGANCYHEYNPVIPGISEPTYTAEELEELNRQENEPVEWKGKQYTKYEALQRQRRLETTMRAQRQEMALLKEGGADEDDLINCRAKYRVTSAEYTRFSEAMGLPQQRERVSADGLGNIMQGKYTGGSGKESPVRVPPVGAKVTNKVTAEERKELLSRDKVDIADNAKTTKPVEKASAVESWETENYKNSTEKGLLVLPDGTTKDFGGIEHHVTGKEEDIKLMDGATFTHNHPTDNTFSQNDIVTGLVKGNLKEMRAVTSTGDVHILVNNGATEQQRKKFNVDYQQRRMKAANVADAKIRRGEKINKDEYVKSRLETFMSEHAEEYNLSYSKTRIDVNKQSIDNSVKSGIIEVKKNPIEEKVELLSEKEYRYGTMDDFSRMSKEHNKNISKEDVAQIKEHTKEDGSPGGYVAMHNYSNINSNMRGDGFATNPLDGDDLKTIEAMRNAISANVLDDDYVLVRYVNGSYLTDVFGVFDSDGRILQDWDIIYNIGNQVPKIVTEMESKLGTIINEKAFVSTSVVQDKNIMTDKAVRFELKTPKGTNAYVTKNKKESECILGGDDKGLDLYIDNIRFSELTHQVIIEAFVL